MYGLPAAQLLSGTLLNQKTARKWAVLYFRGADLVPDRYHRADRVLLMFVAPILYIIHAILAGLAFPSVFFWGCVTVRRSRTV